MSIQHNAWVNKDGHETRGKKFRMKHWGDGAVFTKDGSHRLDLWRVIKEPLFKDSYESTLAFIMLNPSTADEKENDPTIRRCIGFAKQWKYDVLHIYNLFTLVSTDPKELERYKGCYVSDETTLESDETILEHRSRVLDSYNDAHMASSFEKCQMDVVCAWGDWGAHRDLNFRVRKVYRLLYEAYGVTRIWHLGDLTAKGQPRHPLYLPKDVERRDYEYDDLR